MFSPDNGALFQVILSSCQGSVMVCTQIIERTAGGVQPAPPPPNWCSVSVAERITLPDGTLFSGNVRYVLA